MDQRDGAAGGKLLRQRQEGGQAEPVDDDARIGGQASQRGAGAFGRGIVRRGWLPGSSTTSTVSPRARSPSTIRRS